MIAVSVRAGAVKSVSFTQNGHGFVTTTVKYASGTRVVLDHALAAPCLEGLFEGQELNVTQEEPE